LRAGDLCALRVGDVDLETGFLHVSIKKTQTEDRMPITAELDREIRRWLAHYARVMLAVGEPLSADWRVVPPAHWQALNVHYPTGPGRVVYKTHDRYVHPEQIVHRALDRLGYSTLGEGFHTLRRSAARHVFNIAVAESDANAIRVAQALLGHRNQSTTEIYLGITHERVARDRLLRGRPFLHRLDSARGEDVDDGDPGDSGPTIAATS
jgi:integrase